MLEQYPIRGGFAEVSSSTFVTNFLKPALGRVDKDPNVQCSLDFTRSYLDGEHHRNFLFDFILNDKGWTDGPPGQRFLEFQAAQVGGHLDISNNLLTGGYHSNRLVEVYVWDIVRKGLSIGQGCIPV